MSQKALKIRKIRYLTYPFRVLEKSTKSDVSKQFFRKSLNMKLPLIVVNTIVQTYLFCLSGEKITSEVKLNCIYTIYF